MAKEESNVTSVVSTVLLEVFNYDVNLSKAAYLYMELRTRLRTVFQLENCFLKFTVPKRQFKTVSLLSKQPIQEGKTSFNSLKCPE